MNILIVDDHPMVIEGTALFLKQLFSVQINQIFKADNCEQAIEIARHNQLNLVLLDMSFSHGGNEGMQALVKLKTEFESLCVVIYSGHHENRAWVFEALQKGAMGFIPKNLSAHDLTEALKNILSGQPYLPSSVAKDFSSKGKNLTHALCEVTKPDELGLTPRQFDVLRWLVHSGICYKKIGDRLGIGEQAVKNHTVALYKHFGVKKRAALIVVIFEKGIVLGSPEVSNDVKNF